MDKWEKSKRDAKFRQESKNPSFSSTLLDAIYRSIDEGDREVEEKVGLYRETMRSKKSSSNNNSVKGNRVLGEETANLRRACMIEKWMEKNVSEKVDLRRNSMPDFDRKLRNDLERDRSSVLFNSTSSSSDSSGEFGFSSSSSSSGLSSSQKLKPVRTSVSVRSETSEKGFHCDQKQQQQRKLNNFERNSVSQHKSKQETSTAKSRALKFYEDLKKVKQPISPGGRVATFLNSLFTAGNPKKPKISSSLSSPIVAVDDSCSERKSKSTQASTCSSVSSFSRSCLSKTPSSRGKFSNGGIKRSVRFYPVSVIFDEDCRPCGHKCLYEEVSDEPSLMEITTTLRNREKTPLMEKNRRIEEAARDLLLKGFQKKKSDFDMRDLRHDDEEEDEDEDDDDDAASYSSSDLFELDNLAAVGIERYREELPVYETTRLHTNRAIVNGLIL